jgi:tetratricopeptide (TPR) repeat protein
LQGNHLADSRYNFTGIQDLGKALECYEKNADISERLAAANRDSEQLQRDLAISYERLGGIYEAQGDLRKALECYEKNADISERLAVANRDSEQLQQGMAISYLRLGGVYQAWGDLGKALKYYQNVSTIFERLAAAYPDSMDLLNGVLYSKVLVTAVQAGSGLADALRTSIVSMERSAEVLRSFMSCVEPFMQANMESSQANPGACSKLRDYLIGAAFSCAVYTILGETGRAYQTGAQACGIIAERREQGLMPEYLERYAGFFE